MSTSTPGLSYAINVVWSLLNLGLLFTIERRLRKVFVSQEKCEGQHKLCDERHVEICARLDRARI